MKIRKATKKDIPILNKFSDELHMHMSKVTGINLIKKQLQEEHIKSEKELKKDEYYVAEIDGEIVGSIIFAKKVEKDEWKGRYIEIHHIIVSKEYRGKGIGKKMFELVKTVAKKKKANIMVDTAFQNKSGIVFYEQMGFKPSGLEMLWRL